MNRKIIIIYGPTAVGKTSLSLILAGELNAEIISADSMQVYKYLNIGTAKPSSEEMKKVKHHLINICEPYETFSAGDFVKKSIKIIKNTDKNIIICGGTAMYIYSLINGIHDFPKIPCTVKEKLSTMKVEELFSILREKDPEYADSVEYNDKKRISRALEIILVSGKKYSEWINEKPQHILEEDYFFIKLTINRQKLYNHINHRVDIMLKQGWLKEIKNLLNNFPEDSYGFKQAIGYEDLIDYIKSGEGLEKIIENIKRKTRNYAKRQITWFNKFDGIIFDKDEKSEKTIIKILREII